MVLAQRQRRFQEYPRNHLLTPEPSMRKINTKDIAEMTWSSPKGKFAGAG